MSHWEKMFESESRWRSGKTTGQPPNRAFKKWDKMQQNATLGKDVSC
jgi:hypothetical protein